MLLQPEEGVWIYLDNNGQSYKLAYLTLEVRPPTQQWVISTLPQNLYYSLTHMVPQYQKEEAVISDNHACLTNRY